MDFFKELFKSRKEKIADMAQENDERAKNESLTEKLSKSPRFAKLKDIVLPKPDQEPNSEEENKKKLEKIK